jgi:acyl-homoserine lactone acylase PvdQ
MRRPTPLRSLAGAGVALLCAAALAGSALPATAQQSGPAAGPFDTGGAVLNIAPPGSRGNVDIARALQAGPDRRADGESPENFADQLEMYDAINTLAPGELAEDRLGEFFKDAPIDLPEDQAVSMIEPRPGVTIRRDAAGVPFVTGVTSEDVAYGAGYAGTQDRMFLTDLLRHVGAARSAEFLGPDPAGNNVAMDAEQLRVAAYTREEAEAQVVEVLERFPQEGPPLLARLDAFLEGINAAQRALCPLAFGLPVGGVTGGEADPGAGFGPNCPVEYAALRTAPADFTRGDIYYIASLVGGIFGKGGGGETANALWLNQLQAKYGAEQGIAIFEDLRERNDPEAPTSATVPFPYEGEIIDPTASGAAVPDVGGPTAPGTGADAGGSSLPIPLPLPLAATDADAGRGQLAGPFGPIDLGLRPRGMSNALLVDAAHSANGHPTVVFGPQTGYFAPQLLTEISLRGPGIAARGVSFTGTQLIIQLGHGVDYAWSATSASSDIVDTVAERLCNEDGSQATVESTAYLVDGVCTPFDAYVHEETALPSLAGMGLPELIRLQVQRTRHGIVLERATVDGAPVALVTQRSTYTRELDSAIGFARINDPDFTRDAESFQRAFDGVDFVFNWFYADDRDISYFGSGRIPIRAEAVSPDLPRFGDREFDWQGFLPFERKARQTNPPQGYLTSWNNKQAPEFSAADNQWGYGPVYRSLLLDARIKSRLAGGQKITRVGLVEAMQSAAHTDLRAEVLLPLLLDVVGDDPAQATAIAALRAWDAERVDRDREGGYDDDQVAIAVFDEWWEGTDGSSVAKEVLRGTLDELTDELPKQIDDHPRLGRGSAWNGVAWYGYVSKDLRQVLGRPVVGPYSRTYCGGGELEACRADLRASLAAAVDRVLAEQEVDSVEELTYDKSEDFIRSVTAGLVGVRPIDWQNRPTFQQVVSFSTSRRGAVAAAPGAAAPRPAAAPAAAGPARARPAGTLAATGPMLALPLTALLLLAAGAAVRRRSAAPR